jgi:hypothetical protein
VSSPGTRPATPAAGEAVHLGQVARRKDTAAGKGAVAQVQSKDALYLACSELTQTGLESNREAVHVVCLSTKFAAHSAS